MTRAPRVRVSLTFSAISRQHTTSKKEVASSHSWVWRFCHRRLTASPKEAVGCPVLVKRSSGSRVMLPTRTTLLSVAIVCSSRPATRLGAASWRPAGPPLAAADGLGQPDDLVADDLVGQARACGRGRPRSGCPTVNSTTT